MKHGRSPRAAHATSHGRPPGRFEVDQSRAPAHAEDAVFRYELTPMEGAPMPSQQPRTCGSCSLCCKVMAIDELHKPMGVWCPNFKPGQGCSVYGSHPPSCQAFKCLWLVSPTMPDDVRPDRSKVVIDVDNNGDRILARCDPAHPLAWRQEPMYGQLKRWSKRGWREGKTVFAMVNRRMWLIAPDQDIDIGETDPRAPLFYRQAADGFITVTVLPPLEEGETYDPAAVTAMMDRMAIKSR
jgi:hypothetical protein